MRLEDICKKCGKVSDSFADEYGRDEMMSLLDTDRNDKEARSFRRLWNVASGVQDGIVPRSWPEGRVESSWSSGLRFETVIFWITVEDFINLEECKKADPREIAGLRSRIVPGLRTHDGGKADCIIIKPRSADDPAPRFWRRGVLFSESCLGSVDTLLAPQDILRAEQKSRFLNRQLEHRKSSRHEERELGS